MQVQAYLFYNGNCEEALAFYQKAIGAEVGFLMRYGEAPPEAQCGGTESAAAWKDKIMHCNFTVGETQLMASDGMPDSPPTAMSGCALSIAVDGVEKGRQLFDALADGGSVQMPYQPTFWAKGFGMLTDRFGIGWMINCEQ
ncbi:VOC family protein [Jeongeupia sp. USM3]|uniref:VOC family protein n=1 Tax=Jeongeupia sp. USM3 TaxID=1906741 RepID=UPI00089DE012|nr:VOC family protein [Jeongeupia sp. USM3]AOY00496.1 VOC family protein [Jeongeupia sp. USM3]